MSKGKQVSIPYVSEDLYLFEEEMTFKLGSTTSDTEIRYTLDGKEPDRTSPLYRDSVQVNHSCILKAMDKSVSKCAGPVTSTAFPMNRRLLKERRHDVRQPLQAVAA